MTTGPILNEIVAFFVSSAEKGWFNGMTADGLLRLVPDPQHLRAQLAALVTAKQIDCVFAKTSINPHIKRLPDLPLDRRLELLQQEDLQTCCLYPCAPIIREHANMAQWNDRPFSSALALAEPQLAFRAFDMAVLERYTGDPRYKVHFSDYMGRMSITDEYFSSPGFLGRDKVSLQTFGLGLDSSKIPHVVVFLRYLADLSPEHQQYWNSYLSESDTGLCRQYFQASIEGDFWENRSIRYAICTELKTINAICIAIWGRNLFRETGADDVPISLTSFLRPTAANYHRFVMDFDKLLSDNIDARFFEGKVSLETEKTRPDGKITVQRKGSLKLLEEWLLSEIRWGDEQEFLDVVIAPLREVRNLRQKPAHTFTADRFSTEYYDHRRKLMWNIFNSLSNIRSTLGRHPLASSIMQPEWLDEEEIDVF